MLNGISVIIRALNEGKYIGACVQSIINQDLSLPYEVILVDSGSKDDTVKIAEELGCKVIAIPKNDFTFGRALNTGIRNAKFDIIISISAHCIPIGNQWMIHLVEPLIQKRGAMSFGKHFAPESSRCSEISYFSAKYHGESRQIFRPLLNNGNSAFLKSQWENHPFDETLPAQEDMEFCLWHMKNSSATLYFSASAAVTHYHNDRNQVLYQRLYKELSVEFYLDQNNWKYLLAFLLTLPIYILKDLTVSYRKGVILRAFRGILAYRAVQTLAYVKAWQSYSCQVKSRDQSEPGSF